MGAEELLHPWETDRMQEVVVVLLDKCANFVGVISWSSGYKCCQDSN
uniref:Uncharacterized protein n=1 Tax=Physcomitrium patens TaxID=3218 RepID=A0A2K1JK70_PHYPA|nr:hypothetical protein PHYPA_016811 [Physcomitrium patens]